MAEITRKGSAVWSGDLKTGTGDTSTGSGDLRAAQYSCSARFADAAGTNPEELIAAAHGFGKHLASEATRLEMAEACRTLGGGRASLTNEHSRSSPSRSSRPDRAPEPQCFRSAGENLGTPQISATPAGVGPVVFQTGGSRSFLARPPANFLDASGIKSCSSRASKRSPSRRSSLRERGIPMFYPKNGNGNPKRAGSASAR